MTSTDPEGYINYSRMRPEQFDALLQIVGPHIIRYHVVREPISGQTRLALTLRYLASGDSMVSLSLALNYAFRIGKSTVSGIISETCEVLWNKLKDKVLLQRTTGNWLKIAEDFNTKWNFPNCIGAIDGKHIVVQGRPHSGSTSYSYEGDHSLILMAMCDANYCFTLVDIGAQGRQSDGGVFINSSIGKAFESHQLRLPSPSKISQDRDPLPYVMVADEAFSLTDYMPRPYPRASLTPERWLFNYRLSRARRVIENAFGIIAASWRIFRKSILCSTETVEGISRACVCLHNRLTKIENASSPNERSYCAPNFTDTGNLGQGQWRFEDPGDSGVNHLHRTGSNGYSKNASGIRETLTAS